jgi:phosphatidylglycerophosphatase A
MSLVGIYICGQTAKRSMYMMMVELCGMNLGQSLPSSSALFTANELVWVIVGFILFRILTSGNHWPIRSLTKKYWWFWYYA